METRESNSDSGTWDAYSNAVMQAAESVGPAVVHLNTTCHRISARNHSLLQVPQKGIGSGLLIHPDGFILTNEHVIENAEKIQVYTADGRRFSARPVGTDSLTDLAILKIDGKSLPYAQPAYTSQVKVGQLVVAIGNPLGFQCAVTVGVVSALHRSLTIGPGLQLSHLIQTDAAINQGNSGGPLVNSKQEVIGITTVVMRGTQGLGFAIALSGVKNIIDQLVADGRVFRPFLGITGHGLLLDENENILAGACKGVLILEVQPKSPAQEGRIQAMDIILSVNGKNVESMQELSSVVQGARVGEKLLLRFLRGKEKIEQEVILREKAPPKGKRKFPS